MHRGSPPAPSLWTLLFVFFEDSGLWFALRNDTKHGEIAAFVSLHPLGFSLAWNVCLRTTRGILFSTNTLQRVQRLGFCMHCNTCLAAHDDVLVRCNTHSNLQVDLIFLHWQITPVHELRNAEKSQLANNSTLVNGVGLFWTVKSSLPLTHNS